MVNKVRQTEANRVKALRLPKEGSHYDLPIALGVMAAIGAIPSDALAGYTVLGELALDGSISAVSGVLPAAVAANAAGHGLICPASCGPEAAWASSDLDVLAPRSLIQLANHFKGSQVLSRPEPAMRGAGADLPDLRDVKGQETAKRVLEIAAAGGHNLLFLGPKSYSGSMEQIGAFPGGEQEASYLTAIARIEELKDQLPRGDNPPY